MLKFYENQLKNSVNSLNNSVILFTNDLKEFYMRVKFQENMKRDLLLLYYMISNEPLVFHTNLISSTVNDIYGTVSIQKIAT